jgi:hypothetical protein
VNWPERLQAAIEAARFRCVECGNDHVTEENGIPVSHHWASAGFAEFCPVLGGGLAAKLCHEDLWSALEATGLVPVAQYGEVAWARREPVSG